MKNIVLCCAAGMSTSMLVGPQVKYEQAKLQAQAEPLGKKVAVIDMMDYGMMKGDAVLEKALKLLES
ncbi:MAG: hypothetical protein E7I85_11260 [Enterobacter sp.]|nr:hypothetical protein [Enterobacter sp.]